MRKLLLISLALLCLGLTIVAAERLVSSHPCNFAETCIFHDYKRVARAPGSQSHSITIWTRQNNFAADCPSMLHDVSDPDSPLYGKHVSFEAMKELVYDEEALAAIHSFLDLHGVSKEDRSVAPNGEFIKVTAPVATLEKMFNAEFHLFSSVERTQEPHLRTQEYLLPTSLTEYVTIISGMIEFPMYSRKTSIATYDGKKRQNGSVAPQLIWSTYSMPNETDSSPTSTMSVFEALGQSYSPSDLQTFQQTFNLPQQTVATVTGPNDPNACNFDPNNCVEANLDVQYILAMAQGAPLTYWSVPEDISDIFVYFIQEVAQDPTPPLVYSISYGGPESEQDVGNMVTFNSELCKMGLRGLTLFVASGDDGVAGYEARGNPDACGFNPEYPANCQFITTVGATMGPENGTPEVVCQSDAGSIITSGGGFSNQFGRPSYQDAAIKSYFQTANLPPTTQFNTTGRGYPDVAALGNAYNVFIAGQEYAVSGTSAASPVFCAMVALVNGDRAAQGKSPLGFLNPILYKVDKSVYNDITSGENNCAAGQGNPTCCQYGFSAAKGWDATTGWGSIDFKLFAMKLASLP